MFRTSTRFGRYREFSSIISRREGLSGAFRRSRIVTVDPRVEQIYWKISLLTKIREESIILAFRLGPRPLVIVPIRNIEITESLLTMISVIR